MDDMTLPRPEVGQCYCCRSEERDRIDEMLLAGRTFWAIERELSGSGLTARNVKEHWSRKHFPSRGRPQPTERRSRLRPAWRQP